MGDYDSRKFTKLFIERTKTNLTYIDLNVKHGDEVQEKQAKIEEIFNDSSQVTKDLVKKIRDEAKNIKNSSRDLSKISNELYTVASKIEDTKRIVESCMSSLKIVEKMEGQKLYEVTQLINSLMGVVILPYEMHKDFFNKPNKDNELLDSIKRCYEYKELRNFIKKHGDKGNWKSTYYDENTENDTIVFDFLRHIRNAACHSGDSALSILPLGDGEKIDRILFYDHYDNKDRGLQEFAMELSLFEVREMLDCIEEFYCNSPIGQLDKTEQIKKAEENVRRLLGK